MPFISDPSPSAVQAVRDAKYSVFWLDRQDRPEPHERLHGIHDADLVVVGAGFTGLWTAIEAQLQNPDWRIVVLEGARIATGGSGRNGGFMSPSLTHGLANGYERWPQDIGKLQHLGLENLNEIIARVQQFTIDCDMQYVGELTVAVEPHQVDGLREFYQLATHLGVDLEFLNETEVRSRVNSPTYLAAVLDPHLVLMDPAKLAWGLAKAATELGITIHEHSPVVRLSDRGNCVFVTSRHGAVQASRVALATNAYPPLLRRIRSYVVPVYDYVLMSEPLSPQQWESIGWSAREGLADAGNQFHYYRATVDGRILFGGYDAVYHSGNGFGPSLENDPEAYERLAQHFQETFPQLTDVRFTHAWGGAIDTCSRFTTFWGRAHGGKTAYAVGFTGLGTGSSRFAALTMLDLLHERTTVRTELDMVRTKPLPFPGEPLRTAGIRLTTRALQHADRNGGKRNLWLRTLDRFGLGFDS
jgi:glycine/D-amino acid oxidase-like deaminating enzyme